MKHQYVIKNATNYKFMNLQKIFFLSLIPLLATKSNTFSRMKIQNCFWITIFKLFSIWPLQKVASALNSGTFKKVLVEASSFNVGFIKSFATYG